MLRFLLLGWMWVLLVPSVSQACSCMVTNKGLVGELKGARESAPHIYLARAGGPSKVLSSLASSLEVVEVFKGKARVGEVVPLEVPMSGSCDIVVAPGELWLIYADGPATKDIVRCSRSRRIAPDDSELKWLRTGKLPPVPVAMHRESVSCVACDVAAEAKRLLAAQDPADARPVAAREAKERWEAGRPFLTKETQPEPGRARWVGVAKDGRSFSLTLTPHAEAAPVCQQQVQLQWCKRLAFDEKARTFACVEPGAPTTACDESLTRKSEWQPMERIPPQACAWDQVDSPRCQLEAERFPFPSGTPALPVLLCSPVRVWDLYAIHRCRVSTQAMPAPKEPWPAAPKDS
jgi:hypothetical protein